MAITKIIQIVCNQCGECVDDAYICEHCGHDDFIEETFYGCDKCGTDMIDCNPFDICPECGEAAE